PADDEVGGVTAAPAGTPFATAVSTRYFRLMSLAFILIMGAQVGAIQHAFALTKERVDISTAKSTLMILSATSVVARIAGGLVAMRVRLHALTTMLIGVQIIGIALIGMGDSRLGITIGVLVLGSAMGNLLMLHPLLLTNAFGIRDYPRIYGLGSLLMIIGVAAGPALVGIINDQADYRAAFLAVAVLGGLGGLVYLSAGVPPEPEGAPSSHDSHEPPVTDVDSEGDPHIDLDDEWVPRPANEPSVFEVEPV
ncbi:MAG: MFS transporter, partial [Actinomycetota bacterium]|nr:MFS transporter [Actinomycetota bacterium]